MEKVDAEEIKKFISSAISSIDSALKEQNYRLTKPIEFELAVANVEKAGIGIKIFVVDASTKYKT
jgi:hypothetical protein